MKHLIILVLFLTTTLAIKAQGYENNYKSDICACIETYENTLQAADKIYSSCFAKHMTTYAVYIDAEIKEEDKTKKFIVGQKIRRELKERFIYELAYTCNAYVDIIESKKQHVIQQLRSKKIDSSRIDKLNETVAMKPHWANYFNRGQFYYYIGDLQKAERDVLKSIQENPLNQGDIVIAQESLLLAMIYEEQKKYDKAIAIYDTINSKTIIPSIELLKAIVSRKSKGYVLKPKDIINTDIKPIVAKEKTEKETVTRRQRTSPKVLEGKTEQNTTTQTRTTQRQNSTKNKDSVKNLRSLFKLN